MKRVKFVYNPRSGETVLAGHIDSLIALYQREGYCLIPYRLDFKGDTAPIYNDLDHTYHHMVIAGGDGTVNYVINLLKNNGIDIPIAVLPTGTANDFASLLGVTSTNPVKACKTLLEGEIKEIDLGIVNGQYFVNVLSCGLFTEVSQKTPTLLKNTLGKLAYYLEGIGELTRFRRMRLKVTSDGGDFEGNCWIFFAFNGRTAGNMKIAYLSQPDDGLLDVLIIKGDNPLATIRTVFQYISGTVAPTSYPPGVAHIKCSALHAECDSDEGTDVDGQPGPRFPLEVKCDKNSIRMLVPSGNPAPRRSRKKR